MRPVPRVAGAHRLLLRAFNAIGESQGEEPFWYPSGYLRNVIEHDRRQAGLGTGSTLRARSSVSVLGWRAASGRWCEGRPSAATDHPYARNEPAKLPAPAHRHPRLREQPEQRSCRTR